MKIIEAQNGLKQKLRRFTLLIGVLPLIVAMIFGTISSYIDAKNNNFDKLEITAALKKEMVIRLFKTMKADAQIVKGDQHIVVLGNILSSLSIDYIKTIQTKIKNNQYDYTTEIGPGIKNLYIFLETNKFDDIYYVRKFDGQIRFSFLNNSAPGTNLSTSGEDFAVMNDVFKKTVLLGNIYFSDLKFFSPANKPVILVGVPISLNGNIIGAYILVKYDKDLSDLFTNFRFGKTGETYLIGEDRLFRTSSRFLPSTVLREKTFSSAIDKAMEGTSGHGILRDYRNIPVLSSYSYVGLKEKLNLDFDWIILSEIDAAEAFQGLIYLSLTMFFVIIILIGLNWFYGERFSEKITNPVIALSEASRKIAIGDLNFTVPKYFDYFEISQFSVSFSFMVENFKKLTEYMIELSRGNTAIDIKVEEQHPMVLAMKEMVSTLNDFSEKARLVASGNYQVEFSPRSEKDMLGLFLKRMTESLDKNRKELIERDWLKTARVSVSEIGQNSFSVDELTFILLKFITGYVEAKSGLFYVMNEKGENGVLLLTARYGIPENCKVKNTIGIDDGIPGSIMRGGTEIVLIKNLEENYLTYGSGFGSAAAKNILAIPFWSQDRLLGLMELVFSEEIKSNAFDFFKETSDIVSASLIKTLENKRIKELLEKTTNQAEELQAQQEELRAVNEEMAEKNIALEKHRNDILDKNKRLEIVSLELQNKAGELEKASFYKSEFLANMSHELRTPLNSLLLLSSKMLRNKDHNLTEKQIESLKVINRSGTTLLNLINGLLDLAKIESGRMEVSYALVSLTAIAEEISSIFEEEIKEKKLDFKISIDSALPERIETDPPKLKQILLNLVSNSIKFTPGGKIQVEFLYKKIKAGEYMEAAVTDTGIGIPADKIKLIFEAFRQVDGSTARIYGGTGLGLTITREMSRQLGGYVEVESKENQGSKFSVYLPLRKADGKNIDEIKKENVITGSHTNYETKNAVEDGRVFTDSDISEMAESQNKIPGVILIIEDDTDFAHTLMDLCHEKGFKCLYASEGKAGLEIANNQHVDAIMLDLNLPDMQGDEVLENLKKLNSTKNIPVQIISGSSRTRSMLQKGAMGYLKKPVTETDINEALENIEAILNFPLEKILVLETQQDSEDSLIKKFFNFKMVDFVKKPEKALEMITHYTYSCMVIDFDLPDFNVFDFLEKIKSIRRNMLPVIIYTDKVLSKEENIRLNDFSSSIIIKTEESFDRLYSEIKLFLHALKDSQKLTRPLNPDGEGIFSGKSVLIIDDDVRNLFALAEELEEEKMKVTKAAGGKHALELLKAGDVYDLVITDIMMPEMDGYETIKKIRNLKQYREIPIIALTAKAMSKDRELCIQAGASDYLAKPVNRDKLITLLNIWLNRGGNREKSKNSAR